MSGTTPQGQHMRQVTINLYTFNELSDHAKEAARDWWRTCEYNDPAWQSEHLASMNHALAAIAGLDEGRDKAIRMVYEDSRNMRWTGFHADQFLADLMDGRTGMGDIPSKREVADHYQREWEEDMESRMEDDYVAESILANEYEFHEDGSIA